MKRLLLSFIASAFLLMGVSGQIADPVSWTFTYEQSGDTEIVLVFQATIESPWHLYSAFLPEGGPIATKPYINESDGFKLNGALIEVTKPKVKYDEGFQMELGTIERFAEFRQKVIVLDPEGLTITGEIEYQVCDDVTCLPPKAEEFSFPIKFNSTEESSTESSQEKEEAPVIDTDADAGKESSLEGMIKTDEPAENLTPLIVEEEERSLFRFFWIAFGLGLLALLTPCVFPMIPMTVSFFMQGSENKGKSFLRGMIFGLSIVAIYTSLGVIVSVTNLGPNAANALSTHWLPNLIFFALFIVFAFSFFGMFELVLPSSWVNKADKQVDKGGYGGAFFMALTTVLVSFSCTGPIVGALLVEAAGGLALKPILGMFGFALAFAIPFTLFAIFPTMLKSLPKSGGWLNAIKVVLGFIVLAFSMKFLLALDPTNKILTRELYLAVWIVLFFLLGIYFLGKIKFSHDSDVPFVTVPRLLLAVASFTFVVFLITGLFGAELKSVAPLLPPKSANGIDLTKRVPVPSSSNQVSNRDEVCTPEKYTDLFHNAMGINMFYDLEEGLACAERTGKPLLIDFKGHFCSNCKKMEAAVWSDSEVLSTLRNDFVVVALYTDDRTKLPENEWYTSEVDGKVKKTIGQQNIDFEIKLFKTNTIPLYVIMNSKGEVVNQPKGTDLNVQSYLGWLNDGRTKAGA